MLRVYKFYPVLTVILFLVSMVFALKNLQLNMLLDQRTSELNEKRREVSKKESEILSILYNRVTLTKPTYKKQYAFSEFGVYSPLFNDKEMEVAEFSFKRNIIKQMTVKLDNFSGSGNNYSVVVWEQKVNDYSSNVMNGKEYFIVQHSFECCGLEELDIDKIKLQKKLNTHSELPAYLSTAGNNYPNAIEYFPRYTPGGKSVFLRVIPERVGGGGFPLEKLTTMRKDLTQIAATFDYRVY